MNYGMQVNKDHYRFSEYMTKARWSSVWHQLDEVTSLHPERVLEIGPGPGLFKAVAAQAGLHVETMDLDPALNPDHVGSAQNIPFEKGAFDVVCAFQVLEHMPYEEALLSLGEMLRVSRRHVVISLPDAKRVWPWMIQLPLLGRLEMLVPVPFHKPARHDFDGEHYWEISKHGYPLRRVTHDMSKMAEVLHTYRVPTNPYHRFFLLRTMP